MSDLIRREKLIDYFYENNVHADISIEDLADEISAEPKVGKWERKPYKRQGHEEVVIEGCSWRCSNCGDARKRNEPDMNFCPNCGAKMERSE